MPRGGDTFGIVVSRFPRSVEGLGQDGFGGPTGKRHRGLWEKGTCLPG